MHCVNCLSSVLHLFYITLKHPMVRQSHAVLLKATPLLPPPFQIYFHLLGAVGRMPLVISSLEQSVHSSQDLQLFEQPR